MKISEHFFIEEFVPFSIWKQFGDNSIWFIDKRVILFAEWLRLRFDSPVTINDKYVGGQYDESGFRVPDTTTGASLSQHKFGRAGDYKIKNATPDEVRKVIRDSWDEIKGMITTIEKDTPSWTHADCRETNLETLFEVSYK